VAVTEKEVALLLYELFDHGSFDQFDEVLDPGFVADVPGVAAPLDLEAYRDFCGAIRTAFPDAHHTFDRVIGEKGVVVTVGTLHGTHRGELNGIAPTARRIALQVVHVDTIVSGLVTHHLGVADMQTVVDELSA
jgi:predicted ester cyclase